MVRIRTGLLALTGCILFLHAPYIYADDFDDGSDVEPTGPVITISPDVPETPTPTIVRNRVPVADAGPSLTVATGALVVLDGSRSKDPEGTIASYVWKQLSGPTVELLSNRTDHPSFSSGKVTASYIFQLTVRDNQGASSIDVVTIAVQVPTPTIQPTILPTIPPMSTPLPTDSSSFPLVWIVGGVLAGVLFILIGVFIKVLTKSPIPSISGVARDVITHVPLAQVELQFVDQGTEALIGTYGTDPQGQFFAPLPPGVYVVSATKQGYGLFSRENVVIPQEGEPAIYMGVDMMPLVPQTG